MINFEIIKQQIGNSEVYSVNARDLHKNLEVKTKFATWINNRINKYEFIENIDFTSKKIMLKTFNPKNGEGGTILKEYILTFDMALTILQKIKYNPKTAEAIQFLSKFIKKEVIIKEIPRMEIRFFEALENVLKPMKIEINNQFTILNYRLDGYLPKYNLAIEYDEEHHNYNYENDKIRENRIINKLNCKFLRLSSENNDFYNVGLVMNFIMNNQKRSKKLDRQDKILEILKSKKISTKELSLKLKVSKTTILRDLQDLRTEINIKKSKMVEKFSTKLIIRSCSVEAYFKFTM